MVTTMRITAELSLYPMQDDPIGKILKFIDAVQDDAEKVPLTRRLVAALRAHRHLWSERVFCHADGSVFTQSAVLAERAGFEPADPVKGRALSKRVP